MKGQLTHARLLGILTRLEESLVVFYTDPTTYNYTTVLACSLQFSKMLQRFKEINSSFADQASRQMIEERQRSLFRYDGP